MPKKCNVKKSSSALFQNQKQIKAAFEGKSVVFAAVEKSLGSAQFLLGLTEGKKAKGTPRGLFTSGTMRISAGQIVIVEGNPKIGLEIVARFDDLSQVQQLIKDGLMPADILATASVATAVSAASIPDAEEADDLFDYSEEAPAASDGPMKGGNKERQQKEAQAAVAARVGILTKGSRVKSSVRLEDACDLSYLTPEKSKVKKVAMAAPIKKAPASMTASEPETKEAINLWGEVIDEDYIAEEEERSAAVAIAASKRVFTPAPLARSAPVPTSWEDEVDIDAI